MRFPPSPQSDPIKRLRLMVVASRFKLFSFFATSWETCWAWVNSHGKDPDLTSAYLESRPANLTLYCSLEFGVSPHDLHVKQLGQSFCHVLSFHLSRCSAKTVVQLSQPIYAGMTSDFSPSNWFGFRESRVEVGWGQRACACQHRLWINLRKP